jgi:hypothetical protein
MKRRLVITAATAVLAAAGLGAGLGLSGGANAATTAPVTGRAAAAKSPGYVVLDCSFKPAIEPSTYVWTCADYGTGIQDMRWTSWTPQLASGYGTFWENDCTPNCAAGKILRYPVLATFWGSAAVRGYPADRRYAQLTLVFPGKRPPLYGPNGTVSYPLTQTFATNYDHR